MHPRLVALLLVAACGEPASEPASPSPEPVTTDTGVTADSAAPVDTAPVDTAPPVDTSVPQVDCSVPPPVPAQYTILQGFFGAEDFDFDVDGYAVAVDGTNLVGRNAYGDPKLVATGVASTPSGTRLMHDGTWLVADQGTGALRRIDPVTGGKTVLYTGTWPNGIEVDGDDVYLTDFTQGTLMRIDANDPAGDSELLDSGLSSPNGVVLSPDGQTLYVALSGMSAVVAYDRQPDGSWGSRRPFHKGPEGIWTSYQGLNVDICGNVYISDVSRIVRVTPDGQQADEVIESGYLPNMRWGHDVGGFGATVLYGIDWGADALWAIDIGIPGKPHVMGP